MDTLEHIITSPTLLFTLMAGAARRLVQTLSHGEFFAYELFNSALHDHKHEPTVVDYLTGLKLSVTIEQVDG